MINLIDIKVFKLSGGNLEKIIIPAFIESPFDIIFDNFYILGHDLLRFRHNKFKLKFPKPTKGLNILLEVGNFVNFRLVELY